MGLIFRDFQPIAAIATTSIAAQKLQPLCQTTGATLWVPESLNIEQAQVYTGSLKAHIASLWHHNRAFIFCLATGAVVRLIAPLLEDKSRDPAVIVIDEKGQFVISLCSGHQGRADQLARIVAHQLGAVPVLTGASTALGLPGVDILGVPFGLQRGEGDWTGVSAAVARGEAVQVIQEAGSTLWQNHLPKEHPFDFGFPDSAATESEIVKSNQQSNNPKSKIVRLKFDRLSCRADSELVELHAEVQNPKSIKAKIWISPTHRQFSP